VNGTWKLSSERKHHRKKLWYVLRHHGFYYLSRFNEKSWRGKCLLSWAWLVLWPAATWLLHIRSCLDDHCRPPYHCRSRPNRDLSNSVKLSWVWQLINSGPAHYFWHSRLVSLSFFSSLSLNLTRVFRLVDPLYFIGSQCTACFLTIHPWPNSSYVSSIPRYSILDVPIHEPLGSAPTYLSNEVNYNTGPPQIPPPLELYELIKISISCINKNEYWWQYRLKPLGVVYIAPHSFKLHSFCGIRPHRVQKNLQTSLSKFYKRKGYLQYGTKRHYCCPLKQILIVFRHKRAMGLIQRTRLLKASMTLCRNCWSGSDT